MTTYRVVLIADCGGNPPLRETFTYDYTTERGALAAVQEVTVKHHKAGHYLGDLVSVSCDEASDSEDSPRRMTDHHFVQAHRDAEVNSAGRATTVLRKRCVYASCQDLRAFRSWLDLAEHYLAFHEHHTQRQYRLTRSEVEGAVDFLNRFAPDTER